VLSDASGVPAAVLSRWDVDAARVAATLDGGSDLDDEALSSLGIDLEEVRRRTEDAFGPGALDRSAPRSRWGRGSSKGHLPFTPEAKAALAEAVRATVFFSDREIGSAQVFLGLLAVEDGSALRVLRRLGVDASAVELRGLVRAQLDQAA
jgi:hypothetical protein